MMDNMFSIHNDKYILKLEPGHTNDYLSRNYLLQQFTREKIYIFLIILYKLYIFK